MSELRKILEGLAFRDFEPVWTCEAVDQAEQAILALITNTAKIEKDKWKDYEDKFGVGVHAGIEALEYVLIDEMHRIMGGEK